LFAPAARQTRIPYMKSLQGQFLIASPYLADTNFYKGVVLMIKHDDEGAMGLILNRPTENTVAEIWKMVGEEDVECPEPIFCGGPVSGPLLALHRLKSAAEMEIVPGIYFAAHKDKLQKLVRQTTKPFRFFTGYAGWAAGQLEDELTAGGWLTAKVNKKLIFQAADGLWEQVTRTIGETILSKAIKLKHVPQDPSLN
jgi:putative transcriptional regulator